MFIILMNFHLLCPDI